MTVKRTDVVERIIYALVLRTDAGETVIDVGRTYRSVVQRMKNKRGDYNQWLCGYACPSGKKAGKMGFYDDIKEQLGDKKWTTKNLPQVNICEEVKMKMTDYDAELLEGYFQMLVYPTCKNIKIADGHGRSGGQCKRNFGSIWWRKDNTTFSAAISLPNHFSTKRDRNGRRKGNQVKKQFCTIEEAYTWIQQRWQECKDQSYYEGFRPPKTLQHYKNHLGNRYNELFFLIV